MICANGRSGEEEQCEADYTLPERRVEVGLELRCRVELLWLSRLSRMIGRRHMVGCYTEWIWPEGQGRL